MRIRLSTVQFFLDGETLIGVGFDLQRFSPLLRIILIETERFKITASFPNLFMLRLEHNKSSESLLAGTSWTLVGQSISQEFDFRTLADYAPLVIWTTDAQGKYTFINRFWRKLTGRDPKRDLGDRWYRALHPGDQARAISDLATAVQMQSSYEGEYRVRRPKGPYAWILSRGVPTFGPNRCFSGHIGTWMDITARKTTEAKIDSLLMGLETERKRIALELHDDLGQKLALLSVALTEMERPTRSSPEIIRRKLRKARALVDNIASEAYLISQKLYPAILSHLGLVPALRRLCRDVSDQTKITVEFLATPSHLEPPPEVSVAIFRIVQECLSNLVKQGVQSTASVELVSTSSRIRLVIQSSKNSVNVDEALSSSELGLISVGERARMIGGELLITAAPSQGTRIDVRVPCQPQWRKAAAA